MQAAAEACCPNQAFAKVKGAIPLCMPLCVDLPVCDHHICLQQGAILQLHTSDSPSTAPDGCDWCRRPDMHTRLLADVDKAVNHLSNTQKAGCWMLWSSCLSSCGADATNLCMTATQSKIIKLQRCRRCLARLTHAEGHNTPPVTSTAHLAEAPLRVKDAISDLSGSKQGEHTWYRGITASHCQSLI